MRTGNWQIRTFSFFLSLVLAMGILTIGVNQNALAVSAPAVPTGLGAISASYNSIKVSWTASPGASGYAVYRSMTQASGFTRLADTATTTYSNTGLVTGTQYYYKVKAYVTIGESKLYSAATAAVGAKPLPAAPTGLEVETAAGTGLVCTWTAASGASGYAVYRATSAAGTYAKAGETSSTSFTCTGLTIGQKYFFKVKTFRTVGTANVYGNPTGAVSGIPIPDIPAGVMAVSAGYDRIKVSWNAVAGAGGYEVYRSDSLTGFYTLCKTTTATSVTFTGIPTGTRYYYCVAAYKVVGSTQYTGYSSVVVNAMAAPTAPTNLMTAHSGATSIRLSWTQVAGATGYTVYRSQSASSGFVMFAETTDGYCTDTGRVTNTKYYYKVKAFTDMPVNRFYSPASASVGCTAMSIGSGTETSPYSGFSKRTFTVVIFELPDKPQLQLQLLDVMIGAEANAAVKYENAANRTPASDEMWVLLKYHAKYVSGPPVELYPGYFLPSSTSFYTKASSAVIPVATATFTKNGAGLGEYEVLLSPGEASDVWYGILVKKTVGYPLYRIFTSYNVAEQSPVYTWFSADPNY